MVSAVDVRVRRTRERLGQAVLRLAAEHPVEDIAVADVVRLARINRTTFYKHAASPADVLARVLYADLDRIRTGRIAGVPARESWERSAGELADHLQRFEDLYRTGLVGQRSAVLSRLLVEHFAGSALVLLDRDAHLLLGSAGPPAWRRKVLSRFIAHGEVGVVEAWLTEPAPRDRTLFISASASFMSRWLGEAG
jgi:AcrR family transcriptional regulator